MTRGDSLLESSRRVCPRLHTIHSSTTSTHRFERARVDPVCAHPTHPRIISRSSAVPIDGPSFLTVILIVTLLSSHFDHQLHRFLRHSHHHRPIPSPSPSDRTTPSRIVVVSHVINLRGVDNSCCGRMGYDQRMIGWNRIIGLVKVRS